MAKTLEEMIVKAEEREELDDHLPTVERQAIVDAFIKRYGEDPETMADFPLHETLDNQYVYIIFAF